MRPGLILLLSLLAASTSAHADQLLLQISERLSRTPVFRADVVQVKTLRLLSQPLVSEGQMLFSRELGLIWNIDTPLSVQTRFTPEQLVQTVDDQTTVMRVDENPLLGSLVQVFLPALAGDLATLRTQFRITESGNSQAWQLQLQPLQEPLNRFITELQISGSDDLERLLIADTQGDRTELQFSAVQREPAELRDDERARFAP